MAQFEDISESLQRVRADIDSTHRPRIEVVRSEIDGFFDEAETTVDTFFTFFGDAADTVGDNADKVEELSRSAVDILSSNADRLLAATEQAGAEITAASVALDGELTATIGICEASTSETAATAEAIQLAWTAALEEADSLFEGAQRSIELVQAKIGDVDSTRAMVDDLYQQRFVEATASVSDALNEAQQMLHEIDRNNQQLQGDLQGSMTDQLSASVEDINGFLNTVSGSFGSFREATSILPDNALGPMSEVLDLVQQVQSILDSIRPFLDLIDGLS